MKAKITYNLSRFLHPFDAKQRNDAIYVWCLVKEIVPEFGNKIYEPIAVFNYDGAAIQFGYDILTNNLDQKLLNISNEIKELLETNRNF